MGWAGLTPSQPGQVLPYGRPLLGQAKGTSFAEVMKSGHIEAWPHTELLTAVSFPCVSHPLWCPGHRVAVGFDSPFASVPLVPELRGAFIQHLSVQVCL